MARIAYELALRYSYEVVPSGGSFTAYLSGVEADLLLRRDLSWVYPWARTPEVLRHEQGHLQLAEVYRRLLVVELGYLATLAPTPREATAALKGRVKALFREIKGRMAAAQRRYDVATDHGKKSLAQREWEERIARWLEGPTSAP